MGVDGLLKFIQPIISKEHLSSFRNQTAAIDTLSWIYRACYNAADQMQTQKDSTSFLFYFNQMIDLLQFYQIKIICVFDGRFLQHKQNTINKRKAQRQSDRKKGEELIEKGQEQSGKKLINRCVTVDERIISTAMRALKGREIPFIVAPYESDSQIAKLHRETVIDFAICEDSDLIIYGVPVLLKLSNEGDCDYLDINKVKPETVDNVFIKDFVALNHMRRTEVAVLAGTDYLPSIKGIGVKRALKFVTESKDLFEAIKQIETIEKFKQQIPEQYERRASEALLIFLFATTFSHKNQKLQFLNENTEQIIQILTVNHQLENIQKLAGVDYGYNDEVRQGSKQAWSLEPRDLSPIPHDGRSTLNESALRQKEMSLSNLRIVETYYEARSPIIHKEELLENQLRMMCQTRQVQKKAEAFSQLKQQLEQMAEKDVQLILSVTVSKAMEFKSKFPQWMKYCPQEALFLNPK